ncbi:MAG: hypothetical protein ACRD59_13035 [Candidatus Acidiferrales bacterium]
MRKGTLAVAISCLLLAATIGLAVKAATGAAKPATTERYLHVKVNSGEKGESVNVNVPLSLAEKILPTINHGDLHNGRVTISHADINDVDVRAILEAIRTTADNEFVTVKSNDQDVRVAKVNGNIVIHVRDSGKDSAKGGQKVDITVPMKVVDALFSTAKQDELDIAAAIRALGDAGETVLVTVQDAEQSVKIWIDSKSAGE